MFQNQSVCSTAANGNIWKQEINNDNSRDNVHLSSGTALIQIEVCSIYTSNQMFSHFKIVLDSLNSINLSGMYVD